MRLYNIETIARKLSIPKKYFIPYGHYKAKIDFSYYQKLKNKEDGKLILVTAVTPTKAGEGKTTTSIALLDGLKKINQEAIAALREPSLGPVFGLKGGATGGGKVKVEPSEDINLHFNGDFHALTSAINLIAAVIDNYLYQGNSLNIDKDRIVFPRAIDMNDRTLRNIKIGLGKGNGVERDAHFVITVASELMAVYCLAKDEDDFIERVKNIIVAYTVDDKPITVGDLKISNAIRKLMHEAMNPNLVQTSEHNPVLIHGGPFANIAHGCNSLMATKLALKLAPIVITEAGFGSDLGAEKFLDIACQEGNLNPSLCVMVATIRALKLHGGVQFEDLEKENLQALKEGSKNLIQHVENMKKYGLDVVVAINHFSSDTEKEISFLEELCDSNHYRYAFLDGFALGGKGATTLAKEVVKALKENKSAYHPLYHREEEIKVKIERICKEIYHAENVVYSEKSLEQITKYQELGFDKSYICMAKTPNSFSDDPTLLNVPSNFSIHIREINLSAGANFLVPLTGNILTLPGLPKVPQAVKMENEK